MHSKKLLVMFVLSMLILLLSGCVEEEQYSNETGTTDVYLADGDISQANEAHNATLKKTAVLDLDNGYSLKVLEINRKDEIIRLSLRKDGQEYATKVISQGQSCDVRDPDNRNVVYSVHVDKIQDNSFLVDLTYTLRPEISLEASIPPSALEVKSDLKIGTDTITRTYIWNYDNKEFEIQCDYYIDVYKAYSQRSRVRNYGQFVSDPYDDELISQITTQMESLAWDANYRSDEIPYVTMAFVQSLPYISDSVSSGYDEYPRFPFETLYNGGGDCEDSSILLASLLYDMGYGVVLIELPGHMAVGVRGDDALYGNYYEYEGDKYFYLETTNSGWAVGEIPEQFLGAEAILHPIYSAYPELNIEFTGSGLKDSSFNYVNLDITLENVGSAKAEDVVIYAALETKSEGLVWDQLKSDVIPILEAEERISYTVSNLKAPAGERYRVGIKAWGSNADPVYVYSDWTTA
ncbi:MAG: hypothetical protein PWR29_540 [Methanolobus sp.]|jgi:hypothetical protein|nr:hypothetical protein [Methanolobus sp.]MDK2834921.1 hypothetical protein [Methanolobus sp.]MDK2911583.1 hypothetical protein [Methanolobus sp.]MDN5309881.1 hypothetical protein [Methanolobus sp.]